VLDDDKLDPAYQALMLALPTESDIAAAIGKDIDTDAIHTARDAVKSAIGSALRDTLETLWRKTASAAAYSPDPQSTGRRALRYAVLQALCAADPAAGAKIAVKQFESARNMTDETGALNALILLDRPEREEALAVFLHKHEGDHLLVDKWFALHAMAPLSGTAARVRQLMDHPLFRLSNPNRVRALVGCFAMSNQAGFNVASGEGYRVLADTVLALDPLNPQVAARIATSFRSWRMLEAKRREHAENELRRILQAPNLSRDTFEIATKSLTT
jgi:aminopeptidase N